MTLKSLVLSAAFFVAIASGAHAAAGGGAADAVRAATIAPAPGAHHSIKRPGDAPLLHLAQAADQRVQELQEQVRSLTGKLEELNFQILQLQDQLRKMQEDNDFRFKELEDKRGDAGKTAGAETDTAGAEQPAAAEGQQQETAQAGAGEQPATPEQPAGDSNASGEQAAAPEAEQPAAQSEQQTAATDTGGAGTNGADTGEAGGANAGQPQDLGTITVDKDGNVKGGSVEIAPGANASGGDVVAAISEINDPVALYQTAYELILNGDYANAEAAFGQHVQRFPEDGQSADARYWLGEAQLGQNKFQQAAETFLNTSKAYPDAKKAPDTLLKLGVALAGMNNRELACATFGQVAKRFPDASPKLRQRLDEERQQAAC